MTSYALSLLAWENELDVSGWTLSHEYAFEEPAGAGPRAVMPDVHRLQRAEINRFNAERVRLETK